MNRSLLGFMICTLAMLPTDGISAITELEGIEWQLIEVSGKSVLHLQGGDRPSIFLDPTNKKAMGFSGCNNYFGQYELNGSFLKFGPIGATRRACPDVVSDIERDFFAALEKVRRWEIKNGQLALLRGTDAIARFTSYTANGTTPDLDSLTIHSTVYTTSPVTLARGEFHMPAAPDSASEVVVKLADKRAFGTLNGESVGAVVVVTTLDGIGTFYELAMLVENQGWTNTDTVFLGDRIQVHSVAIERDNIVVAMTLHGPQDPMCCPTLEKVKHFALKDKQFVEFKNETHQTQTQTQTQLIGTVWQWVHTRYNNDTQIAPTKPANYTVKFLDEGKLNVKADCNLKGGKYSVVDQQLSMLITHSTMASCEEGSLEHQFVQDLSAAAVFFLHDRYFYIDLKYDTGTMKFSPSSKSD